MSRTAQIESRSNPAVKTLQFKRGLLSYYDKELKENVEIPYPFSFFMLNDDYISFNGFNKNEDTGVYSNEVSFKDTPDAIVTVKLNGGREVNVFSLKDYSDKSKKDAIKASNDGLGARYTQMVYGVAKFPDSKQYQIFRLIITKSAFSGGITDTKKVEDPGQEKDGWVRFKNSVIKENRGNKNALYDYEILISGIKPKKTPLQAYNIPVFELGDEVDSDFGKELDVYSKDVDSWFIYYNEANNNIVSKPKLEEVNNEDGEEVPF
jgi:hypothetical protein